MTTGEENPCNFPDPGIKNKKRTSKKGTSYATNNVSELAAMTDDPATGGPNSNRVSIRAVLAFDGEDVTQALSQAGIFDAVAVPATFGDAGDPPGGILGDGITPNLAAEIELDEPAGLSPDAEVDQAPTGVKQPPNQPVTAGAPTVHGAQSFAPRRRRRRRSRPAGAPPAPARVS